MKARRGPGSAIALSGLVAILLAIVSCQSRAQPDPPTSVPRPIPSKDVGVPSPRIGASARNSNGTLRAFPAVAELPGKALVFSYYDFGPQALAHPFLGQDCYPFGECCCMELGDRFDVRVVVVRGMSIAEARANYPTGPTSGDFRIVTREAALAFLSESLRELEASSPDDRIPTLEATLRATRARIETALPR